MHTRYDKVKSTDCIFLYYHHIETCANMHRTFCRIQSRSLVTKSDITNSGYNEAQKLVPAKILLYMNRNASVIANSGYNKISDITNWFRYPQWTIMPLVTNPPLITNQLCSDPVNNSSRILRSGYLQFGNHFFKTMAGKFV